MEIVSAENVLNPDQLTREDRKNAYEALWGGGEPDAFSLLANGVKVIETELETVTVRREKTGSYADKGARNDINGSHGGMIAMRTLKEESYFPDALLVTNSRNAAIETWPEERHAEVAAKELADLGVPKEDIIVQEESISTASELFQNIRLAENNHWKLLVIITNGAQVLRARAMLEKIDTVFDPLGYRQKPEIAAALSSFLERQKKGDVKISIISAEDVLALKSPRHARLMQAVRETQLYKDSKARQDSAAEQIKAGTYGKKPPPETLLK